VPKGAFKLTRIASGLKSPVFVTNAHDGSNRLFIVEQPGRILVMKNGQLLPTPFLDIRSLVAFGSERGLLGLAFDPDFASNGVFVVDYTRNSGHVGDTVIARYKAAPGSDVADPRSAQTLLLITQPQANHNGGQLAFGPDGYLYIGMGDGGAGGDQGAGHAPQGNGQSLATLLGKILRIDVPATGAYTIPPTNPKLSSNARHEIWAYGLRNPWRFSFDRATGALYIADVGQGAWEEVDYRPASSKGGENYGWPVFEGTHPYRGGSLKGDVKPVAQYPHSGGDCSVSGGYVYRGQKITAMYGFYIFGDYCSGRMRTLVNFRGRWTMSVLLDTSLLISSFGEDEAGELYVVHLGGAVYRFDPA
jgi:glucose/arabinose dehydrogenase